MISYDLNNEYLKNTNIFMWKHDLYSKRASYKLNLTIKGCCFKRGPKSINDTIFSDITPPPRKICKYATQWYW